MISSLRLKQVSLQRNDSPLWLIKRDLKGAISSVKKDEYSRAIANGQGLTFLRIIEHRVKTDSRLTAEDRELLLSKLRLYIDAAAYSLARLCGAGRRPPARVPE